MNENQEKIEDIIMKVVKLVVGLMNSGSNENISEIVQQTTGVQLGDIMSEQNECDTIDGTKSKGSNKAEGEKVNVNGEKSPKGRRTPSGKLEEEGSYPKNQSCRKTSQW